MSPMSVIIHRIIVVINKIIPVDIIHVTVSIIINPVIWNFTRIYPDISCKVRMSIIHTSIKDGNNNSI